VCLFSRYGRACQSHAKPVHELLRIPVNVVLEIVVISHAFDIHLLVVHRANFPCQFTEIFDMFHYSSDFLSADTHSTTFAHVFWRRNDNNFCHLKFSIPFGQRNQSDTRAGVTTLISREKVQRIAWKRRLDTPIIVISTSPSGLDALDPTVTFMPRSTWITWKGFETYDEKIPAESFILDINLRHPGFDHLTRMLIAVPFDPPSIRVQAADNVVDGGAAKMMNTRVRLVGLVGAAHLNGEEGTVVRRDSTGRPERVIVRLHCASANTTEVSVKDINCQHIDDHIDSIEYIIDQPTGDARECAYYGCVQQLCFFSL
jgi:hypothetical protein